MGHTDKQGNLNGPVWNMLSHGKAPGVNNMLDDLYHDKDKDLRDDRRQDLSNWIYDVFNNALDPSAQDLRVKTMLLSKTGKSNVESLQNIRTICISNVHIKALEATLRWVT